jgi:ribonuclease PH
MLGLNEVPLFDSLCAVSVGVVDGQLLLDLDYAEDSAAEVDMNVVVTGDGRLVEVQATAEGEPYARATLERMLDLAAGGAADLAAAQAAAVATLG